MRTFATNRPVDVNKMFPPLQRLVDLDQERAGLQPRMGERLDVAADLLQHQRSGHASRARSGGHSRPIAHATAMPIRPPVTTSEG